MERKHPNHIPISEFLRCIENNTRRIYGSEIINLPETKTYSILNKSDNNKIEISYGYYFLKRISSKDKKPFEIILDDYTWKKIENGIVNFEPYFPLYHSPYCRIYISGVPEVTIEYVGKIVANIEVIDASEQATYEMNSFQKLLFADGTIYPK